MATLLCKAAFVASKVGKTGLTVTLDLYRIALADATSSKIVADGACAEVGGGLYVYRYASADLATYEYVAVFKTADSSVDAQHVFGQPLVVPDELTSSRAPAATALTNATWTDARAANLDAAVSSRLATAGYTAPDNASITAVKAKTDNLPAQPAAVGSAMTLATGAITAAVVATGAIDADALASDAVTEITQGTWNAVATGYDVAGSMGALLNDAGSPTLTATVAISATQAAQMASGALAIRTHHTFGQSITSTSTAALNTATKLWLAVKEDERDGDNAAVVFIEASAGLLYLAEAAYATAAHGMLTVGGSSGAWTITASLDEAATGLLTEYADKTLWAEVKALVGNSTVAVWDGICAVSCGIVQAVA